MYTIHEPGSNPFMADEGFDFSRVRGIGILALENATRRE
jgi:hypothetical protein